LSGLKIYIDEISQDGLHCEGEIAADVLDLSDGEFVVSKNPLRYELDVSIVSNELLAFGRLAVDLQMCCSRCTVMFPVEVREDGYSFNMQVDKTTEFADLTEDIREAIILAFSSYPVCSQECKGLCPQCGANLNKGSCECSQPGDLRWAGLDSVLTDKSDK